MKLVFGSIVFLCLSIFVIATGKHIEVGIDEQLGKTIPLQENFVDENGNKVLLKDLFTKPTVLSFVYYNCPGICSPLLMELSDVINKSDLVLGVDYNIVSISMDQFETPKDAMIRKQTFLKVIDKNIPPESWRFLTGDSATIKKVADAAGFYFKRQGKEFLHSGAFIFVDINGKICRYLFPSFSERSGFGILPFDFKMSVIETSEGKVTPTIAKVLQFCFKYDPQGKTYVLNITQIFGAIILILVAIFLLFLKFKPKKEFIKAR
ncbi:MAG: SCO family protein [Ignavibacteriaceae bacterium]|jgi:protein SCO1/2|nr:SCO family protein [Ignavibacterium sp.]MCC6253771.1 SCO family protein [Ignavibacteriaceae bacterium]HRN25256.1 SCO family protein [Ignavibacteriaceae bacterium]HRP94038.1 SCO family protein [Ignavibacteriaceae bacterium]HRQ52847.1 SCO family protein [Ignavibacteriaceae bacterium]